MSQQSNAMPLNFLPDFLAQHRLPAGFADLAMRWYQPLCEWLIEQQPRVLGINGGQGSGKSTLADFIAAYYRRAGKSVAVLSIDDLYLTQAGRQQLATEVHPLLATRGVPGTHDVELGIKLVQNLQQPGVCALPQFDKAADDRSAVPLRVEGPVDLVILEGWCVGSVPEPHQALNTSVNELEEREDENGLWRRYVNDKLEADYPALFQLIDAMVLLKVPSFEQVYQWRCEQEAKLEQKTGKRGMSDIELQRFVQHYERLTRWNLMTLPGRADAVFELNAAHGISAGRIENNEL